MSRKRKSRNREISAFFFFTQPALSIHVVTSPREKTKPAHTAAFR